ncbi:hypothetical protein [Paenibacillus azoreducens]|uniref:Uncharacterized protein n=1 Tax=Paenibacillus azoreducens TaxID=116718 RepID=A0A919YF28_9BACL|nr:hypothetical protein [Paenibacillus azoreducens]GIO49456.1 hypothetical protein J34TS1_42210 [Paenibacillus azoreducens]
MANPRINSFITEFDDYIKNKCITCGEIVDLKNMFYSRYKKEPRVAEAIIYRWFAHYLGIDEPIKNEHRIKALTLRPEKKYVGKIGKQNIDISVLEQGQIKLGISIKMQGTTPAYLDGADFYNPILMKEYRDYIEVNDKILQQAHENKTRVKVPTLLQDFARIDNLQLDPNNRFQSATFIFDAMKDKEIFWVREFESKYNHKYLFLLNKPKMIFKEWVDNNLDSIRY